MKRWEIHVISKIFNNKLKKKMASDIYQPPPPPNTTKFLSHPGEFFQFVLGILQTLPLHMVMGRVG